MSSHSSSSKVYWEALHGSGSESARGSSQLYLRLGLFAIKNTQSVCKLTRRRRKESLIKNLERQASSLSRSTAQASPGLGEMPPTLENCSAVASTPPLLFPGLCRFARSRSRPPTPPFPLCGLREERCRKDSSPCAVRWRIKPACAGPRWRRQRSTDGMQEPPGLLRPE